MAPAKPKSEEMVHLEALPKAVKRALRVVDHGLTVIEVRLSNNAAGEHGKTTIVYTAKDAAKQRTALDAISKQSNIEQDNLLRDDEEDA